MPRLIIPCCVILALALLTPATEASLREPPRRVKPPTVGEALRLLDTASIVTREAFRLWTGVRPVDGAFSTRWRLADGVLVTNYMEVAPGRLVIACWYVETK